MKSEFFRASVGLAVLDGRGHVLAVERYAHPGEWQLPQGGIRAGEDPAEAALREMWEELGLRPKHVDPVATHPEWLSYELPEDYRSAKTGRGQTQRWFAYRLRADESKIRLDHGQKHRELRDWRWWEVAGLAPRVAGFRTGVYRSLEAFLLTLPDGAAAKS